MELACRPVCGDRRQDPRHICDYSGARRDAVERVRHPSLYRLAGIDFCRDRGRYLYPERIRVEQGLTHMSTSGGELGRLPAWVRTLPRVQRWVGVKITLYHVRRMRRKHEKPHVAWLFMQKVVCARG
jgi:hypothetical protein